MLAAPWRHQRLGWNGVTRQTNTKHQGVGRTGANQKKNLAKGTQGHAPGPGCWGRHCHASPRHRPSNPGSPQLARPNHRLSISKSIFFFSGPRCVVTTAKYSWRYVIFNGLGLSQQLRGLNLPLECKRKTLDTDKPPQHLLQLRCF